MLSLKRPDVFLFLRASAEGEEHSAKDQSRLCQLQALAPLAPACLASQVPLCLLTPRLRFFCSRTLPPDHLGALPSRRALCLKYLPYLSPFYLIISYPPPTPPPALPFPLPSPLPPFPNIWATWVNALVDIFFWFYLLNIFQGKLEIICLLNVLVGFPFEKEIQFPKQPVIILYFFKN